MSIVIKSGSSSDTAKVTTDGNVQVVLPDDADLAGAVKVLDSSGREILTTENGALNVSQDSLVFYEQVDGAALNTNTWSTSTLTMAVAQAAGFITLNSAAITTAATYAILTSVKAIPLYGHLPVKATFNIMSTIQPQAGAVIEIGIGTVATTAAPTDGVFFRWNASGAFLGVINNNGSEIYTANLTPPANNDVSLLEIVIIESGAQFLIGDVIVAEVDLPAAQAYPTNTGRLPVFARTYTTTAPSNGPVLKIGQVVVVQQAMVQNKTWNEIMAGMGRGLYQSPVTTFGQTANRANSATPASASLSNTVAGYATLGGAYQFAAPAGAVTDFVLFGYQVPEGYQLYVTGISISAVTTGAAVGISGTVLRWALGINGVTVAANDASIRREPLGTQGLPSLAAIGTQAPDLRLLFPTPIVIDRNRFVTLILQVPVGLATGSQVIMGDVAFNGYWE